MTVDDAFGRTTAPLRRFHEAAYWYHAKKQFAWKDEFDYYLRAFAQAFASAVDALENSWKLPPKPARHHEMKTWWTERRVEDNLATRLNWVGDLRAREFHTTRATLPPSKRVPVGVSDPSTGGFIAFFHHQIPGDAHTVEWYVNGAFFGFKKALDEFGQRFGKWSADDVKTATQFPESLKRKRPASGGPIGEFSIGPGPYESFGPNAPDHKHESTTASSKETKRRNVPSG